MKEEQIGERNRRVEIWAHDGTVNSANMPLPSGWSLFRRKWVKIKGETGLGSIRNAASSGVTVPLNRYSYRGSYDRQITAGMQVRFMGLQLDIIDVRHDDADREWTDIIVQEGGANG